MGPTERIAEFTLETRLADVPAKAIEGAKIAVLDTIGVSLAAAGLKIGQAVTEHVASLGGAPQAQVFGAPVRTSAPLAALANGTLAHALDYDDHGHVSTYCLPSALAIGQMKGLSGAAVLEAYIVSREVANRIVGAVEAQRKNHGGPTYRGWYRVGVVGPLAAACAAGKLLGLSLEQLRSAIGIAASSSGGLRRNQGTMTKALHAGNGASDGVHAALLASHGFTGDPEILEAPLGLFNALCLEGECDVEPIMHKLGQPWELAGPPKLKPIPACTPSHKPVELALTLKREHNIAAEDVEAIEIDLHTFSLFRLDPHEALAAGFNLPYLLSVAFMDGYVGVDHISDTRIHDAATRAMMARVRPPAQPVKGDFEHMTVILRDGRRIEGELAKSHDLGSPEEIDTKFRECAGRVLSAEDVSRLKTQIEGLEELANVNDLVLASK
ncbi:MAG: MmgE/PrpD family protein [Chloroflexi bacterium]|nr:MmgE/PrpD family protein [Chloroflexota bacterium]